MLSLPNSHCCGLCAATVPPTSTAPPSSRCCFRDRSAGRIDRWPRSGRLDDRSKLVDDVLL
eukprot:16430818-Heterocapsa_arctica.AAC.1